MCTSSPEQGNFQASLTTPNSVAVDAQELISWLIRVRRVTPQDVPMYVIKRLFCFSFDIQTLGSEN